MKTREARTGALLCAAMAATLTAYAGAPEAPLFERSYFGSPTPPLDTFTRIAGESTNPVHNVDPAALPPRFSESVVVPAHSGAKAGMAFFGQFVDHDITLSASDTTSFLIEPFVDSLFQTPGGEFVNMRTPAFDLDSVYGRGPFSGPSAAEGWYDNATGGKGLRFRFGIGSTGGLDFLRDVLDDDRAFIGDPRNDENGMVGQIHRAIQQLHNARVDHILERDGIDEASLVPNSPEWRAVFHEARNYTNAYYQGIIGNQFALFLTGRTLWDAAADVTEPIGGMPEAQIPIEFSQALYRLHTIVPNTVQVDPTTFVSPIDPVLRDTVNWEYLFGPMAHPASEVDTGVAAELRDIIGLHVPGSDPEDDITLDLAQVNTLRGRETSVCAGEEYLAFLLAELGLPANATTVRGKTVLDATSGAAFFDPILDAPLIADLTAGNTDLWVYIMAEASLNGGVLGPVGQDIFERTILNLYWADDWSMLGANGDQFTPEMLDVFMNATWEGLLDQIYIRGDLNGDGRVTGADLAIFLGQWGTSELAADIDDNGIVNGSDLAILLGNWTTN